MMIKSVYMFENKCLTIDVKNISTLAINKMKIYKVVLFGLNNILLAFVEQFTTILTTLAWDGTV